MIIEAKGACAAPHEGEHLSAIERLVVSPAAGIFTPVGGLEGGSVISVGDVLGRIPGERRDALRREEIAHRRIDVLIGAAHVAAALLQQRGERRHGGAADADEVVVHRRSPQSVVRSKPVYYSQPRTADYGLRTTFVA